MIGYRPFSGAGSFSINALLLLAISGSLTNLPDLRAGGVPGWRGHGGDHLFIDLWQPSFARAGEPGPRCPSPGGSSSSDLLAWALPEGFDTHADSRGPHFACIRFAPSGRVAEVRVPGHSDAELERTIEQTWRVSPGAKADWQRVRLTRQPSSTL